MRVTVLSATRYERERTGEIGTVFARIIGGFGCSVLAIDAIAETTVANLTAFESGRGTFHAVPAPPRRPSHGPVHLQEA